MKTKSLSLVSGSEEQRFSFELRMVVTEKAGFNSRGHFHFRDNHQYRVKNQKKNSIRSKDRTWVMHNIPSSIWWKCELHHDWKDGNRMYLLTKAEHILRHRSEKSR